MSVGTLGISVSKKSQKTSGAPPDRGLGWNGGRKITRVSYNLSEIYLFSAMKNGGVKFHSNYNDPLGAHVEKWTSGAARSIHRAASWEAVFLIVSQLIWYTHLYFHAETNISSHQAHLSGGSGKDMVRHVIEFWKNMLLLTRNYLQSRYLGILDFLMIFGKIHFTTIYRCV